MHQHLMTSDISMGQLRRIFLSALTAALMMLSVGTVSAQVEAEPHNRVVIVIDGSGSYKARQTEAVERAVTLLDGMAQTKLHRWEPATDHVSLISLDAIPEVLWQGTLQDLKKLDRAAWFGRFRARTDYAHCTDVSAAFRLAAQSLEGDFRSVSKYLFVFSDLIHEPPTTSIAACQRPKRPSLPPEEFPWGALQDVSVAVFWVPPDQKLAWRRVVEEQGLTSSFALHSASESTAVTIAPPPRPTLAVTEADREAERGRYLGYFTTLIVIGGGFLALLVLVPLGILLVGRLWPQRSQPVRPLTPGRRPPLLVGPRRPEAPVPPSSPRPSESPANRRQ